MASDTRIEAVQRALARLQELDVGPLSEGLSSPNAARCLAAACAVLHPEALAMALDRPGRRPRDLAVVAAPGVFTAPLEWVAVSAAAGIPVCLKASRRAPRFGAAIATAFSAEGLEVRLAHSHDLGAPEVIVAMGSDEGVASVVATHPASRVVALGHRFSLAHVSADPDATVIAGLAADLVAYDTRGCMAPVAIFTTGAASDLAARLQARLAVLAASVPIGEVDPALGPRWRHRQALARVHGRALGAQGASAWVVPPEHFTPEALPRTAVIHEVWDDRHLGSLLVRWRPWLSTLGTDRAVPSALSCMFGRVCRPGEMQQPPVPRRHDGHDLLGCVLDPVWTGAPA